MDPEIRKLTAIFTSWEFYECVRIRFVLMNAPEYFQGFMQPCFFHDFLIPYLDDLLVYSGSFKDSLKHAGFVL